MRDGEDKVGIWTMLEEASEYVFCSWQVTSRSTNMAFQSRFLHSAYPVDTTYRDAGSGLAAKTRSLREFCEGDGHRAEETRLND